MRITFDNQLHFVFPNVTIMVELLFEHSFATNELIVIPFSIVYMSSPTPFLKHNMTLCLLVYLSLFTIIFNVFG